MALHQLAQQAGYVFAVASSLRSVPIPLTVRRRFIMYEETTLKLHRWSRAQLKRSKADPSSDKVPRPVCEIFNSPRPQVRPSVVRCAMLCRHDLLNRAVLQIGSTYFLVSYAFFRG